MLTQSPLDRFTSIHAALQQDRRWWRDSRRLRYAALAAIMCDGTPMVVARGIRRMGDDLKNEFPWYWSVNSSAQFVVAALLLQHRDSARRFLKELIRVRKLFRKHRLRRALQFELLAVLILRIQAEGRAIPESTIRRFKSIYDEMKRYHRFLTGPDDFPACAILTGQPGAPQVIGNDVEAIYDELRACKFQKGNPLQTAANIMYLGPGSAHEVAGRAATLRDEFRENKLRITQRDYGQLAILSILQLPTRSIVSRVLEIRERLAGVKPKIDRALKFDLATGIAFVDLVSKVAGNHQLGEAKALLDVQALVAAQQAVVAAAAASAAATAAAT
ncbi:MAG: DUF4003 family protein [Gemmatimonadota bacterium]|nr:MAG: DUF4003 family protein [Gemmatimonadota bacterium]